MGLLKSLEAVIKGTTDADEKFWLTVYGMLPEFISNFLEAKLGQFSHSVSNTQSAGPAQTSPQTTPAKSPCAVQSPLKSCCRGPRLNSPGPLSEKSPLESKGKMKKTYKVQGKNQFLYGCH